MQLVICFFEFLGEICKNFFYGFVSIIKGRNKVKFMFLMLSIVLSIAGFFYTEIYTLERTVSLLLPVPLYFFILGIDYIRQQKKLEDDIMEEIIANDLIFEKIGMKNRNGEYPLILDYSEDSLKGKFVIESSIPLSKWKTQKEDLEVVFDKVICSIKQHPDSKQMVLIETLPANYKLDTFIKWNDKYIVQDGFTLVLGKSIEIITTDLEIENHLLIGGCSNIGKSVLICCLVYQCIIKKAKIYLMDFKYGIEFNELFEKFGEVVMDRNRALEVLEELTNECERRLRLFRSKNVKKLSAYNKLPGVEKIARIVIFVDEIAEMLDMTSKDKKERKLCMEIVDKFSTLARQARAAGIHLICAMQKADAEILKGQIKANMNRVCGAIKDSYAIRQFLGVDYTVNDFIQGRFLYRPENDVMSFQGFYFDSNELMKIEKYEPDGILLLDEKREVQDEKKEIDVATIPEVKNVIVNTEGEKNTNGIDDMKGFN